MSNNEIKFKSDNLYQFRKEKGISQEELGNIIGVSRQAVSKWESGERVPDINNLNALCKTFDKTLEDFIEGADELLKTEYNYHKKKINLKRVLIFAFFAMIILYILTVIIKATVINIMFIKMNKYKEAKEYYYISQTNYYSNGNYLETDVYDSKFIYFKDKVQNVVEYNTNGNPPYSKKIWTYTDKGELFEVLNDENRTSHFYLQIHIPYLEPTESSPYDLTCKKITKLYNISFILDPLKVLKIDFKNNDLIFETKYKNDIYKYSNFKDKIFIDMKKGLLSKEEKYMGEVLVENTVYYGYNFEQIRDEELFLTEDEKNEIKEKHRIESEEYNRLMQQNN